MNKFLSTLGLCKRAGFVINGFDSVKENIKKLKVILISNDISLKTDENIRFYANKFDIRIIKTKYSKDQLGQAINSKPVAIIGILDDGFSKLLINQEVDL